MWDKLKHELMGHDHESTLFGGREPWRFWFAVGALVCIAMLVIALRGDLGYYIHPRYHVFTIIMVAVAAVFLLIATVQYAYKKQTEVTFAHFGELVWLFARWLLSRGAWIVVLVAILLFTVPAAPLMSDAASRKGRSTAQLEYVIDAPWFQEPDGVYELSAALSTSEGKTVHMGETFTVSGFVREDADRDIMRVSRFVIACCTVDASPYDVAVYAPGWREQLSVDDWVQVTGSVDIMTVGATHMPILRPDAIEPLEQPEDPYEYL